MEVNADQTILVPCKILFFIVLQDFPINCSKSLTLIFGLRPFSHSRWCLHAGRLFSMCRAGVGSPGHWQTRAGIHLNPKQDYCYLPLASLADVLYRSHIKDITEGSVGLFFPKNLCFLLSFMNSRGLLLLLPVLHSVTKKVTQYTCCPSENVLMALWPALEMPGYWKNRRDVLLGLMFI